MCKWSQVTERTNNNRNDIALKMRENKGRRGEKRAKRKENDLPCHMNLTVKRNTDVEANKVKRRTKKGDKRPLSKEGKVHNPLTGQTTSTKPQTVSDNSEMIILIKPCEARGKLAGPTRTLEQRRREIKILAGCIITIYCIYFWKPPHSLMDLETNRQKIDRFGKTIFFIALNSLTLQTLNLSKRKIYMFS